MLLCAPTTKKTNENSQVYAGFSWNFHRNGGTFKPVPSMERNIKLFLEQHNIQNIAGKNELGIFTVTLLMSQTSEMLGLYPVSILNWKFSFSRA